MINFIENSSKFVDQKGVTGVILMMSVLNTPYFLTGIANSIILMSAILAAHTLSVRSEIVIMRSSGLSLWVIIQPMICAAFLIGVFWVFIFDPLSIIAKKKFYDFDRRFVKSEMRDAIEPDAGIWLKQDNLESEAQRGYESTSIQTNKGLPSVGNFKNSSVLVDRLKPNSQPNKPIILILAKKIYQDSLRFGEVSFWFFDKNQIFYKRIDANFAEMANNQWQVSEAIINDDGLINYKTNNLKIATNLDEELVRKKIVNDLKAADIYNIFELQNLIDEMFNSGLNNTKFKVRFSALLTMPFLFAAMSMIGSCFGINHARSGKSNLMIFLGLVCGLAIYITSSIINALGSSGAMSVFASTWIVAIIILAIGIISIYSKESH